MLKSDVSFPCKSWASANRDQLEERNSCLEFKLHRLQFVEMVSNCPENSSEVLRYAKQFARFATKHTRGKINLIRCVNVLFEHIFILNLKLTEK